jgi:uncharacterized protein YbaP (TraB family)
MSDEVRLTPRWPRYVVIAGAAILGLGLLAAVAMILFASGQGPPSPAERRALADEVCPTVTATHFFRVIKDGKTSYLLGTRHAGISLAKFPPAVEQAFRASKAAVFESEVDREPTPTTGPAIHEQLEPELWNKYRDLVGKDTAERVDHASVIAASAALALLYEDTSQGIDRELYAHAKTSNKRIVALEDRDQTDHLGEEYLGIDSLRAFIKSVRDRDDIKTGVRVSLGRYCNGGQDNGGLGRRLDNLTDKRTAAWLPELEALFAEGEVFVAVGETHVEDAAGLVAGLRARGYTIER